MSDRTYAETQGEAPFDWWHALNNPEQYDYHSLCDKAEKWVSCAVGNQCAIIPRSNEQWAEGEPIDAFLNTTGRIFARQVGMKEWHEAQKTLAAIEARSAILIAEELAKLNQSLA